MNSQKISDKTTEKIETMDPVFSLKGKTLILTGAAGFLGQTMAQAYGAAGANLVLVDNHAERLSKLQKTLSEQLQRDVMGLTCDITRANDVAHVLKKAVQKWGGIDVLHNNATGRGKTAQDFFAPDEEYSLETWKEVIDVNVNGVFLMTQAVGKCMIDQRRGGSIIQTASIYGTVCSPDPKIYDSLDQDKDGVFNTPAVYSTSKAAILGLTKHLAVRWAPHAIRVNAISPGGVENDQPASFKSHYLGKVPMKRMARPNDIVHGLIYLASDASRYVTGQNLVIDGGFSSI